MTTLVRYGSYNIDQVDTDSAKADAISGSKIMDLEVGDNIIRFIPPKIGVQSPHRVTAMHFIDAVPGLDKILVFACPRVELRETCIACAESERLSRSPNPLDRERAFRISAGLRVYSAVIDRKIGDLELAVKVLAAGKKIYSQVKTLRKNPRLGGDYTNPTEDGFDICIHREGTGRKDTTYTVTSCRDNNPLASDAEITNWIIENQPDLEQFVKPVVPEELIAAWEATTMRRSQVQVPRAGSALMQRQAQQQQTRQPSSSAVIDAQGETVYDDDFNVIPSK